MQVRNLFLAFLCATISTPAISSEAALARPADTLGALMGLGSFGIALKMVADALKNWPKVSATVVTLGLIVLMQKEAPDFFSNCVRHIEMPFSLVARALEKRFAKGRSMTWNEAASWHNRVSRLLTPLTKTTSMVDLSKDRRLRIMDQEDGQEESVDLQWKQQVAHIEREFEFIIKVLTLRLLYYKDEAQRTKKKPTNKIVKAMQAPANGFNAVGKALIKVSLVRNEEVAFGLEEVISYLKETVDYCKSVSHFSALDKEHVKRLMGNICTTFEHIGVLVDEVSAADKSKKKIPMTPDGSLTRSGYAGSGYGGGYDTGFGVDR